MMPDWGEYAGRWDRDEFGIPLKPKCEESAQDRLLREAKVGEAAHLQLSAIYRRLQKELGGGEDGGIKARQCFDYFASQKPKYKKGQHGGDDEVNEILLEMYDRAGMSPADFAIGFVNERVQRRKSYIQMGMTDDDADALIANQFWRKAGRSADSIERRIRRLLKEREGKSERK
jgi:hypothetical protein